MALVTKTVPNLLGGVSQQPDTIRFENQCNQQDNAVPSILTGLNKRPPTEHVAGPVLATELVSSDAEDFFVHSVNRSEDQQYQITINADNEDAKAFVVPLPGTAGSPQTLVLPSYFHMPNASTKASTTLRAVTIADFTFLVNTSKTVAMTGATSATIPDAQNLFYMQNAGYGTKYTIKVKVVLDDGTTKEYETGITTPTGNGTYDETENSDGEFVNPISEQDNDDKDFIDTSKLVDEFFADMNTKAVNANSQNPYEYVTKIDGVTDNGTVAQGHVWVQGFIAYTSVTAKSDFLREGGVFATPANITLDSGVTSITVVVSDGRGNTEFRRFGKETDIIQNLPTIAPNNFKIKVVGAGDSFADDYYLVFNAENDEAIASGNYQEAVGPGLSTTFDAATMPHVLIRQSNGTFTVSQCDGSSFTGGTAPVWNQRSCGDDLTNPLPTFVGKTINDIFLFKNRLGFLSDENVILSETSEFFGFFRTTVLSLLDTAPLDVASTDSAVSILTSAVAFSRQLILFSDQTQFVFGAGSAALTPKTVAMTKTTGFESVSAVRPITLGSSVYFGFTRGEFSGIRRYIRSSDTETIFDAVDISVQVPQFIKGELRSMAGSSHEDIMFVSTNQDRNVIYAYKFFDNGDTRAQSAWGRFVFDAGSTVLGMSFVNTDLVISFLRSDGIYTERIRFDSGRVDTGATYLTLLDRRVDQSQVTKDATNTVLELPYTPPATGMEVITAAGSRIPVTNVDAGNKQITIAQPVTTDFFAGVSYEMVYKFSEPVLREGGQNGPLISEGRKQLRHLTVQFADTSFFKAEITPEARDTRTQVFTARQLGAGTNLIGSIPLESGKFRVPIHAKSDEVSIVIKNDTPLPCKLTSAEYELSFNARQQRFA